MLEMGEIIVISGTKKKTNGFVWDVKTITDNN